MVNTSKKELLLKAYDTLNQLSSIYNELVKVYETEQDRKNAVMFLDQFDSVIETQRTVHELMLANIDISHTKNNSARKEK